MKKKHPIINFLRANVNFFSKKQTVIWDAYYEGGPCVFVCNHARAMGPLAMCSMFPYAKRMHPWIIGEMLSPKEVPAYIRQDFWWQQNKWYTKICDYTLTYIVAAILPPILRGTEPVPVYHDMRIINTFKKSVAVLEEGDPIAIFPEKPEGFGDYAAELNTGFLYIAKNYYKKTGKVLTFYPTYIDEQAHTTHVYPPVKYDPNLSINDQTGSLIEVITKAIVK